MVLPPFMQQISDLFLAPSPHCGVVEGRFVLAGRLKRSAHLQSPDSLPKETGSRAEIKSEVVHGARNEADV